MRLKDWPERLGKTLREAKARAYLIGDHDCALHVSDAALAVTGTDPAAPYRGKYKGYAAGLRNLKKRSGASSLEEWADQLWPRVDLARAQRGDWALAQAPIDESGTLWPVLMVVDGAWLIGAEGTLMPRDAATIAWTVG